MKHRTSPWTISLALLSVVLMVNLIIIESQAWARAGGGGSMGSRGSRSFSTPQRPSSPGPGFGQRPSSPYSQQRPDMTSPAPGSFMRNPFVQGLAGGLLGGFVGNLLFGGRGYASPPGGMGGGGIGLLDIILIGLLLYFVMKYFRRRRMQSAGAEGYSGQSYTQPQYDSERYLDTSQDTMLPPVLDVDRNLEQGLAQIKRRDPRFNENEFKEIVQDLFFRIQAAWMNRSLEGAGDILADEMANIMASEFAAMNQKGQINRLENIAVRKVEIAEAWQESGKDYMTVLFTANLLDYTVDDKSGEVVAGDRRNPVKFEEFWTFCRAVGESQWRLTAINQVK